MDIDIRDKLGQLIKQVTETGELILDTQKLKMIKSYCKRSDALVLVAFEYTMAQLKKKHAQIRYSCLQLIEQLFERSRYFRDLLTEDFPLFTQLSVGIQDKKLPPPVQMAAKLRVYAIALIKSWLTKYGDRYRQLGIAYDFLMNNGFLDQDEGSTLSSIHAANRNKSNTDARRKAIQSSRFDLLKADINDHIDIIRDNLTSMEGCFEILIPKHDFKNADMDFEALLRGEASVNETASDTYKESIMSHGLGSSRYQITIDLSEESLMEDVKETDDNKIIFDQLREAYTQLESRHLNQLNSWINTLAKLNLTEKKEREKLIKELIQLKAQATEEQRKAKLLGIKAYHQEEKRINSDNIQIQEEDDDEYMDEEFEDIDVAHINTENNDKHTQSSSKLPPTQRIFPLAFEPSMMEDATYSGPSAGIQDSEPGESSKDKGKGKADSEKEDLRKRAPVVEWGEDLYYWDKKNVQFNTSGLEKSHRFMGSGEGTNEMPEHLLEELRKRPIYYKSEAPKEIRPCRHPLKNGGLCPRRDLVTCPFHGRIIPRDELGKPLNEEDAAAEAINTDDGSNNEDHSTYGAHDKRPDPNVMNSLWELLEPDAVSQAAGHSFYIPRKRCRGSKKEKPKKSKLADVRKKPDTSYARLSRQINSSKTRKMVDEALEYEREMKARNKEAKSWQ